MFFWIYVRVGSRLHFIELFWTQLDILGGYANHGCTGCARTCEAPREVEVEDLRTALRNFVSGRAMPQQQILA